MPGGVDMDGSTGVDMDGSVYWGVSLMSYMRGPGLGELRLRGMWRSTIYSDIIVENFLDSPIFKSQIIP